MGRGRDVAGAPLIKWVPDSKCLECAQILCFPQCWSAVGDSECAQEASTGPEALPPTGGKTCNRLSGVYKTSRILETLNILMCEDSSTDT